MLLRNPRIASRFRFALLVFAAISEALNYDRAFNSPSISAVLFFAPFASLASAISALSRFQQSLEFYTGIFAPVNKLEFFFTPRCQ